MSNIHQESEASSFTDVLNVEDGWWIIQEIWDWHLQNQWAKSCQSPHSTGCHGLPDIPSLPLVLWDLTGFGLWML
jgi:hypothetical protein